MIIYATPYDGQTRRATGPSLPAGFQSLADVTAIMGPPRYQTERMALYGEGVERIAYSDFVFVQEGDPCLS